MEWQEAPNFNGSHRCTQLYGMMAMLQEKGISGPRNPGYSREYISQKQFVVLDAAERGSHRDAGYAGAQRRKRILNLARSTVRSGWQQAVTWASLPPSFAT